MHTVTIPVLRKLAVVISAHLHSGLLCPFQSWTCCTLRQSCGAARIQGNGLMCPGGKAGEIMAVRMRATKPNPSFVIAWCAQQEAKHSHASVIYL